jgi:hypothetical protein
VSVPRPIAATDDPKEAAGWFRRFCRFVSQRFRRATRTLASRRSSWFAVHCAAHASRLQRSPLIDQSPSHSDQLGSLLIGHGGPQRNDFGWDWIALGPALDPSIGKTCVFPTGFGGSSRPSSPTLKVKPASAKRRQIETSPRDSLGFFVSSSEGSETVCDDSGPRRPKFGVYPELIHSLYYLCTMDFQSVVPLGGLAQRPGLIASWPKSSTCVYAHSSESPCASSGSYVSTPHLHAAGSNPLVADFWKNRKSSWDSRKKLKHRLHVTGLTDANSLKPCFQYSTSLSPSDPCLAIQGIPLPTTERSCRRTKRQGAVAACCCRA